MHSLVLEQVCLYGIWKNTLALEKYQNYIQCTTWHKKLFQRHLPIFINWTIEVIKLQPYGHVIFRTSRSLSIYIFAGGSTTVIELLGVPLPHVIKGVFISYVTRGVSEFEGG